MLSNMCRGDKAPLGVVTAFFMLTVGVSTTLAIWVSQQAAYLWLSFVLIGILFLTTFTRSNRTPAVPFDSEAYNRRTSEHLRACGRFTDSGPAPPYYVRIDPPPSYNAVITISPDNCEPPPYINVVIQNPAPPPPINYQTLPKSSTVAGSTPVISAPIAEQLPILQHLVPNLTDNQSSQCLEAAPNPIVNSSDNHVQTQNSVTFQKMPLNENNVSIPTPGISQSNPPNSVNIHNIPSKNNNESTPTTSNELDTLGTNIIGTTDNKGVQS
ncbi:hypothetical protein WDU94_012885 [Cyamophila willieti]